MDEWFSVPPLEATSLGADEPVLGREQKADGPTSARVPKAPAERSSPRQQLLMLFLWSRRENSTRRDSKYPAA